MKSKYELSILNTVRLPQLIKGFLPKLGCDVISCVPNSNLKRPWKTPLKPFMPSSTSVSLSETPRSRSFIQSLAPSEMPSSLVSDQDGQLQSGLTDENHFSRHPGVCHRKKYLVLISPTLPPGVTRASRFRPISESHTHLWKIVWESYFTGLYPISMLTWPARLPRVCEVRVTP